MRIITISREFGSGGRELGKHLADSLGFDYYDREIISMIAENYGFDEKYVERTLDSRAWHTIPISYRCSFSIPSVMQPALQTGLLLEQRQVIEKIAQQGKDCVIVGRNADVILESFQPFRVFVFADWESRVRRCLKNASESEGLSQKEIEKNMRHIDKNRAYNREIISDSRWGDPHSYDLLLNTTDRDLSQLAPLLAEFALAYFERNNYK